MKKEIKMVLVEWRDARFLSGTYNKEAIKDHKMAIFNSLGYLISKDKITIILAAECNDKIEYRDRTLLPAGSIISIKKLLSVTLV